MRARTPWSIAVLATAACSAALAQTAAPPASTAPHYDLNVYPTLPGASSPYNLNVATVQNGPPGTIAVTNAAPPPAYSFQDVLANTHGYVSTGVATHGGYEVSGGVTMPIAPGKADLSFGAGTGGLGGLPSAIPGGKSANLSYDSYYAGLHLHPTDDIDAFIGISGLRLHSANGPYYPYALP
jgi:hypothetical protein